MSTTLLLIWNASDESFTLTGAMQHRFDAQQPDLQVHIKPKAHVVISSVRPMACEDSDVAWLRVTGNTGTRTFLVVKPDLICPMTNSGPCLVRRSSGPLDAGGLVPFTQVASYVLFSTTQGQEPLHHLRQAVNSWMANGCEWAHMSDSE